MPTPRFSVASRSLSSCPLQERLVAAADVGFHGVELWRDELLTFPGGARGARVLCDDLGIDVPVLQLLRDAECQSTGRRAEVLAEADELFDMMEEASIRTLLVCSTFRDDSVNDPERAAAELAEIAQVAQARGLELAYEALSFGRWTNTTAQAWHIVRRADHANLRVSLDSAHFFIKNTPWSVLDGIPAERIGFVQLADLKSLNRDCELITLNRTRRVFPGEGTLPLREFVGHLAGLGYAGYFSLEIFNDELGRYTAPELAERAMHSIRHLFEH